MRRLIAVAVAVTLAGCASAATAVITSGGPLGPGGRAQVCYPWLGTVTDGWLAISNQSRHPVTLTAAHLTGIRQMRTEALYGDVEPDGNAMTAAVFQGWPAAKYRHLLPVTVPAGGSAEVIIVVTVTAKSARATGEDLSYSSQGQSYLQHNLLTVRLGHC